jgi:hypothetical protein
MCLRYGNRPSLVVNSFEGQAKGSGIIAPLSQDPQALCRIDEQMGDLGEYDFGDERI